MDNNQDLNTQSNVIETPKVEPITSGPIPAVDKPLTHKNSNNFKLAIILSAVMMIFSLSYAFFYVADSGNRYNAEISLVSGMVEKSSKSGTWVELNNGDNVSQGDLVRTINDGRAIITLDDGSAIRLGNNTIISLGSLDPSNILIDNQQGEVYTRVIKADRPFIVTVNGERYQSLGTAYKTINTEGQKGVFVYESKVKLAYADVEVGAGSKYFVENLIDKSLANKTTPISTDEITTDEFVQWNKEKDLSDSEFKKNMGVLEPSKTSEVKTETPKPVEVTEPKVEPVKETVTTPVIPSISLRGEPTATGVNLMWTTKNVDVSKGFKIVRSTSINPVYPGNTAVYVSKGSNHLLTITDGLTYNFRICQYTGNGCNVYSNNITLTMPKAVDGVVSSITLSGFSTSKVTWVTSGYSDNGFKVVWSKATNPTYPNRTGDRYLYASSPESNYVYLEAFDGTGEYYVRVCEYLDGKCGVYSNEIILNLEADETEL